MMGKRVATIWLGHVIKVALLGVALRLLFDVHYFRDFLDILVLRVDQEKNFEGSSEIEGKSKRSFLLPILITSSQMHQQIYNFNNLSNNKQIIKTIIHYNHIG